MTRFQKKSEKVVYEIAQVTIIVENKNAETGNATSTDEIVVYAKDGVRAVPYS